MQAKKKLTISRETISILRTQTGIKTGQATCDNACGKTTDNCKDVLDNPKCNNPPAAPPTRMM